MEEFWYPVRLIQYNEKEKEWSVRWWRGCDFGPSLAPAVASGSITSVKECDIVDSLWGDRTARRAIRVFSFLSPEQYIYR